MYKKTLLAKSLGLTERVAGHDNPDATFDVAGVLDADRQAAVLTDPAAYLQSPLRPDTITHSGAIVLSVFVLINLTAAAIAFWP